KPDDYASGRLCPERWSRRLPVRRPPLRRSGSGPRRGCVPARHRLAQASSRSLIRGIVRMKAEDWLQSSIMSKRAVAKGAAGTKHSLTIEQQGKFHYVYGPYAKPTLSIDPGGIVVVETEDAFGGVLT